MYGASEKNLMAIYIDRVWNYIDKLQDENKHLKEQLLISNSLDNMYNLYISKDKIRDKIKELEEELQYECFRNGNLIVIDVLKSLLEEE